MFVGLNQTKKRICGATGKASIKKNSGRQNTYIVVSVTRKSILSIFLSLLENCSRLLRLNIMHKDVNSISNQRFSVLDNRYPEMFHPSEAEMPGRYFFLQN